jgi:hypothetical protein
MDLPPLFTREVTCKQQSFILILIGLLGIIQLFYILSYFVKSRAPFNIRITCTVCLLFFFLHLLIADFESAVNK